MGLENLINEMAGTETVETVAEPNFWQALPPAARIIAVSLFLLLTVALIVLAISYSYYKKLLKEEGITTNKKAKTRNHLHIAYKIFTTTPYVSKYFERVKRNTESLFPSDPMSVNREATKIMLANSIRSLLISLGAIILAKGDLFYSLVGIMTSLVIFNYSIVAKFEKYEFTLLQQMLEFISNVRHYFLVTPIIEDAVQDTLDELPYEISLHIEKIHEMLISPTMKEKVEDYTTYSPNRFMLLLVSICTTVKEYSDTTLPDGSSNFLNSLNYLKEEVNVELLKKKLIASTFAGLEIISLIVVFFMKPIEAWAISNMPELNNFYKGNYGKAFVVGVFIISYICYYLVDILRNSRKKDIKQNDIFSKVSNITAISPTLNKVINHNYTKALTLNDHMKEVGDQTGPKAFLVKKIVFALAGFLIINTMFTTNVIQQKLTMLNEYVGNFDESLVPNEKYLNTMREASTEYALKYKDTRLKDLNEEVIKEDIIAHTGIKSNTHAEMIAQGVVEEIKDYKNTYYKWYYLLVALIGTLIAFYLPDFFLNYQRKVSAMNKEDELNQFQTLILILMYTDGISLDIILEWMERFAYIFKASLEECIIELESGEKRALEHLKNKEEYIPFKRFVDCLLQIDESDVPSAFGEIQVDRIYSLKEREQQNQITTYAKAAKARRIAYTPLFVVIVCYLIAPMLILAIRMFVAMDLSL